MIAYEEVYKDRRKFQEDIEKAQRALLLKRLSIGKKKDQKQKELLQSALFEIEKKGVQ